MPIAGIKTRTDLQNDLFCLKEERDFFESRFLEQVSELKALKQELAKSKKEIRRLRMFLMDQDTANNPLLLPPDQIDAFPTPKNHNKGSFRGSFGTPRENALCEDKGHGHYEGEDEGRNDSIHQHIAEKDDASSLTAEEIEELDQQDETLEREQERQRDQERHREDLQIQQSSSSIRTPSRYESDRGDGEEEEEEEDVRKSAEKLLAWASYRSTMSNRSLNASRTGDLSSVASPSVRTSGSARVSLLGKMIETADSHDRDDDNSHCNNDCNEKNLSLEEEKKDEDCSRGNEVQAN
ncbi:unnamed protein product [Pseudo-nitzschia multistriata]|uniref:Uncharacterized protein n=1 Tax=Pseudo-nitzschia multistriata TaxID=183589 RepID=A0A448ZPW8_9STRA|nr:unnamed protein product [Pseudo-nitzschia multistriata]